MAITLVPCLVPRVDDEGHVRSDDILVMLLPIDILANVWHFIGFAVLHLDHLIDILIKRLQLVAELHLVLLFVTI